MLCEAQNSKKIGEQLYQMAISADDDLYAFQRGLSKAIDEIGSIYRKLNSIRDNVGQAKEYNMLPVSSGMEIKKEGLLYHFILPERLPHRITIDKYANRLKYDYDPAIYYSIYRTAVEAYVKEYFPDRFKRKVVLYIRSHGIEGCMLDNDNIEVKTFADAAIKGIFVKDDAPQYLSIHLDAVNDIREYTEMYLGYPEDIFSLILTLE